MKNKKLTVFIVFILLFVMVPPAFADGPNTSTRIDALCNIPEIRVTVPPSANVYINPFNIPVEIDGESIQEQIVCDPSYIENASEVPISVSASVTGVLKEGSDMRLISSSTEGVGLTSKSAFVYFEIQAAENPDQAVWDQDYDATKHIIVRTSTKAKKNIVTIAQADQPKHFGVFRLTGDCVPTPRREWTEADGIDVSIAFTFKPLPVSTKVP
jgi:hypothetical protein